MCVNEVIEFVGRRGGVGVDVMWVHGMKRGDGKSVREEDRHHRQVLVTVELSSFFARTQPSAVTRTRR